MPRRLLLLLLVGCVVAAAALQADEDVRGATKSLARRLRLAPHLTLEERLAEVGPRSRARWSARFAAAGAPRPPGRVVLLALKEERRLEVYAGPRDAPDAALRLAARFAVRGASGGPGPKSRSGDRQLPEGVYACEGLNPNSIRHVSLRVGYPNAEDRAAAADAGVSRLGGDVMIHGGSGSIGCLAVGDEAAEDLFTLAADVGVGAVEIVIAPCDLRVRDAPPLPADAPPRTADLWRTLRLRMASLGAVAA
ncbi:MAG TPA: hypothetical protein VEI02_05385, partial [Planctomycetota bacterium]|nr:hypothetical protein [Planctomycetota bacterium]